MSNELKFIPTSMTDFESLPESVGDVIKQNVDSKICLTNGKLTSKSSLGFFSPDSDKGHHYTAHARSGASLGAGKED